MPLRDKIFLKHSLHKIFMQTTSIVLVVIVIIAIVVITGYLALGMSYQPHGTTTSASTQSTSVQSSISTISTSANTSTTVTSISTTSVATTTIPQSQITRNYLMVFFACDTAKYSCMQTFGDETYLAQSKDGMNWSMFQALCHSMAVSLTLWSVGILSTYTRQTIL